MTPADISRAPSGDGCVCDRDAGRLLDVTAAVARAEALCVPVGGVEAVPLAKAAGRIAAACVITPYPMPGFDHAAMDGYALSSHTLTSGSVAGASGPWVLPVTGVAAAGGPGPAPAADGTRPHAIRILTGAALPAGFDRVVAQEDCTSTDGRIMLRRDPPIGAHIRRAGEDAPAGTVILATGTRIDARHVALLAIAGHAAVPVLPRLRVAVMTLGDELVPPGQPLGPGRIHDSNRPMLLALLTGPSTALTDLGAIPDQAAAVRDAIAAAAGRFDLILSTGGASVGDRDHLKPAFQAAGGVIDSWGVAIKPGKPVMLGRIGGSAFLGLPGNPVAAFLGHELFATAMLRRLSGQTAGVPPTGHAGHVSGSALTHRPGRTEYLPARPEYPPARTGGIGPAGRPVLRIMGPSSAARLMPLAGATGFAVVDAAAGDIRPGDPVGWLPFSCLSCGL